MRTPSGVFQAVFFSEFFPDTSSGMVSRMSLNIPAGIPLGVFFPGIPLILSLISPGISPGISSRFFQLFSWKFFNNYLSDSCKKFVQRSGIPSEFVNDGGFQIFWLAVNSLEINFFLFIVVKRLEYCEWAVAFSKVNWNILPTDMIMKSAGIFLITCRSDTVVRPETLFCCCFVLENFQTRIIDEVQRSRVDTYLKCRIWWIPNENLGEVPRSPGKNLRYVFVDFYQRHDFWCIPTMFSDRHFS